MQTLSAFCNESLEQDKLFDDAFEEVIASANVSEEEKASAIELKESIRKKFAHHAKRAGSAIGSRAKSGAQAAKSFIGKALWSDV
jgi:hypothetical protein